MAAFDAPPSFHACRRLRRSTCACPEKDSRTTRPHLLRRTRRSLAPAARWTAHPARAAWEEPQKELVEERESAQELACAVSALRGRRIPRRKQAQLRLQRKGKPAISLDRGGVSGSAASNFLPAGCAVSRGCPVHLFPLIFGIIGTHSQSRKEAYRICDASAQHWIGS